MIARSSYLHRQRAIRSVLQQIEASAKIGRMTLGKLPDREDWRALIDTDATLAEKTLC